MSPRPVGVLRRPALRILQDAGRPVYLFTLTGEQLLQVADLDRLARDADGKLRGYQRGVVRRHVKNIVEYLNSGDVLFPNSIILALRTDVRFTKTKSRRTRDEHSATGILEIPLLVNGGRPAWIVDGQQRLAAISESRRRDLALPVNAFVAVDTATQREHFLRLNATRPLPRGLITELLPELASVLPPTLASRRIPSALCELLNRDPESPFRGLIRRASTPRGERRQAIVADTALIRMLEDTLNSPTGCLFAHRNIATGYTDFVRIRSVLFAFWSGIRSTFPNAWGLPPTRSRLLHSAGIRALGRLMDRVMGSLDPDDPQTARAVRRELARVAPICRWESGRWEDMGGLPWNELQNVPSHVRMLSDLLVRTYLRPDC